MGIPTLDNSIYIFGLFEFAVNV